MNAELIVDNFAGGGGASTGNSLDEFITHFGYKDVATAFMELQIINKSWEMNDLPFRFEENPWRIFLKEEHPLGAP